MPLLDIVKEATRRIAVRVPNLLASSSDPHEAQLMSLATEDGRAAARRFDWRVLTKEVTFVTVNASLQPGVLPADLQRIVSATVFNRTTQLCYHGAVTNQQWQSALASNTTSAIVSLYRLLGSDFYIYPAPAAGETIAFEYISSNWNVSGGTPTDRFIQDTDTPLLSEELLTLGVKWRYLQQKGLNYSEEFASYERLIADLANADRPGPILSLDGGYRPRYFEPNVTVTP